MTASCAVGWNIYQYCPIILLPNEVFREAVANYMVISGQGHQKESLSLGSELKSKMFVLGMLTKNVHVMSHSLTKNFVGQQNHWAVLVCLTRHKVDFFYCTAPGSCFNTNYAVHINCLSLNISYMDQFILYVYTNINISSAPI